MLRSILAVLAGFVVMAVVVMASVAMAMRVFLPGEKSVGDGNVAALPAKYLTVNLVASAVAAVLGGYVAAMIAGHAPIMHGVALAVLMALMSMVSMRHAGATQPRWYQWTLATVMPLLAVGGAWVCCTVRGS